MLNEGKTQLFKHLSRTNVLRKRRQTYEKNQRLKDVQQSSMKELSRAALQDRTTVRALQAEGIPAAVIGRVAASGFAFADGTFIDPPREDALYDAFARYVGTCIQRRGCAIIR